MFIPARKVRGPAGVCTRMPRLLSVATVGVMSAGAVFGLVPAASADPPTPPSVSVAVDVVGDSYMAGEGIRDTYIDAADPRHRSLVAPALQALSRLETTNSRLRVDANIVAASGAATADFFNAQKAQDNAIVNPAQRDQVRPDAQMVIVGFGGEDARLATVLADAKQTANGPNVALDKEIKDLGPLLDWAKSQQEYFDQAKSSPPGRAPTLVARMLQVLIGISGRAPRATIMVVNYPLAVDPQHKNAASAVGDDELTTVRKFGYDLNKSIQRAVQLCQCASLVDVSGAVAGHEAYTGDSAFNEQPDQQAPREQFRPNRKGASLIANPIAADLARLLSITPPAPSDGRMTIPQNIGVHNGVSDRDGDRVADTQDHAPDDPTRSKELPKSQPKPEDKHTPGAEHESSPHKTSNGRPANRGGHNLVADVTKTVSRTVNSVLPGHGQARPNDQQHTPGQTSGQAQTSTGASQHSQAADSAAPGQEQAHAGADRRPAGSDAVADQTPADRSGQRRETNAPVESGQTSGDSDRRSAGSGAVDQTPADGSGQQAGAGQAPTGSGAGAADALGQRQQAARSADGDRRASLRELFSQSGPKKPRPADTTPIAFVPPATALERENQATPQPADKRVTGTENSERKPAPATAISKLKARWSSAPASGQAQDEAAQPGSRSVRPAAAYSPEREGMAP